MMLSKEQLPKADVVASICLLLLGAAVIWGGTRMPLSGTYGGVVNTWYVSPAAFPILVGAMIVLSSAWLLARAIRQGALEGLRIYLRDGAAGFWRNTGVRRTALIYIWIVTYTVMLRLHPFGWMTNLLRDRDFFYGRFTRFCLEAEGINYVLSSFVFLTGFIMMFLRPHGKRPGWGHLAGIVCLSAVMSFGMGYAFSEWLSVPLP
jgi:hypothetical protein